MSKNQAVFHGHSGKLRAVVVEDDAFVMATLQLKLARKGIEVVPFGALTPAREFLAKEKVDFAVIDLGLPDGEGLDLLKFIRQTSVNKDTPVIIATANRSDAVLEEALGRDGAMFVSQKPIDWSCLEYVIDGTVLQNA